MSEHPLDPVFHPRATALVGVPRNAGGSRGGGFLLALEDQGYPERSPMYLVNPNADEIRGHKVYPSLLDCPDPVDHVISLVPSRFTPDLVEQAVQKGVRSIHFFTAGFAESGQEDMKALQRRLIETANAAGIRVFGPNCMGLYVPEEGLAFQVGFPRESGNVMGISQSGGNAMDIVMGLGERGVRFSKMVSFGNAADVGAPELFDYAASDPDSDVVVSYLEGGGGRALFEALRRCAAVKPTIVLKGGITPSGARAASSHTASLAGSTEVFDAMVRQTGAIRAETMEELHDLTVGVLTRLREVAGTRALMVGGGGGFSVLAADAMYKLGVDLPDLSTETTAKLAELIPIAGNSFRNPIDAGFVGGGDERAELMEEVMEVTVNAPGVDCLILATVGGPPGPRRPRTDDVDPEAERERAERRRAASRRWMERVIDLQKGADRPVLVVGRGRGNDPASDDEELRLAYEHGLAVFPSVPRAARTIAQLVRWREQREGLPVLF